MGWWNDVGNFFSKTIPNAASSVGNAINDKVLKKVFGSQTGALTPITNTVADKAVGGSNGDLLNGFKKATVGGGAIASLDYLGKTTKEGTDWLSKKARENVPIVGGAIGNVIDVAGTTVKDLADVPNTAKSIGKEVAGSVGVQI